MYPEYQTLESHCNQKVFSLGNILLSRNLPPKSKKIIMQFFKLKF